MAAGRDVFLDNIVAFNRSFFKQLSTAKEYSVETNCS